MAIDPLKYVIGFECLNGPPTVDRDAKDEEDDPDRLHITFGMVQFTDKAAWPSETDSVFLTLETDEDAVYYSAYELIPNAGKRTQLWTRHLVCVQNPELAQYMSWL